MKFNCTKVLELKQYSYNIKSNGLDILRYFSLLGKKNFDLKCMHSWRRASKNTLWCLLGCAIGDMGTILFFQVTEIAIDPFLLLALAMTNGILFSIFLETIILLRQMELFNAFRTACGMSLISMISMEISMNLVDFLLVGELKLTVEIVPIMLFFGFITPLPYNYWRLKVYGVSCH